MYTQYTCMYIYMYMHCTTIYTSVIMFYLNCSSIVRTIELTSSWSPPQRERSPLRYTQYILCTPYMYIVYALYNI